LKQTQQTNPSRLICAAILSSTQTFFVEQSLQLHKFQELAKQCLQLRKYQEQQSLQLYQLQEAHTIHHQQINGMQSTKNQDKWTKIQEQQQLIHAMLESILQPQAITTPLATHTSPPFEPHPDTIFRHCSSMPVNPSYGTNVFDFSATPQPWKP
jgi:hypothetical protein